MSVDYASIGLRIKRARVKKGISQEELAIRSYVSRNHISNIESMKSGVSLEALIDIANALEISTDELLVDNLLFPNHDEGDDAMYLLLNCSENEKKLIIDIIKGLKSTLTNYRIKEK